MVITKVASITITNKRTEQFYTGITLSITKIIPFLVLIRFKISVPRNVMKLN